MGVNDINGAFQNGYKIKLQNRGPKNSGITFELKAVFQQMVKDGIITDKGNDGFTKDDAQNLFAALDKLHKEQELATNYTRMQVGQEFAYDATSMKALAEAAGYEVSADFLPAETTTETTTVETVVEPVVETVVETVVEPEAEPEVISANDSTIKSAPIIKDLTLLHDGSKILDRDILNIGGKGSTEKVFKANVDGTIIYREVITDKATGGQTAGKRLVSNNRGLLENEFYAVDNSIKDGVEVDPKMVDGKKDVPTFTEKDANGKTQRFAMVLQEDRTYAKGDRLIDVAGSKNFKTETAINNELVKMFNNSNATFDGLASEGVSVQYVNTNGSEHIVFKKDGKIINGNEVKNIIANSLTPTFDVEAAKKQLMGLKTGDTIELNGVKYTAEEVADELGIKLKDDQNNVFNARYLEANNEFPARIFLENTNNKQHTCICPDRVFTSYYTETTPSTCERTTINCNDGSTIYIDSKVNPTTVTITNPNGTKNIFIPPQDYDYSKLVMTSPTQGEIKAGETKPAEVKLADGKGVTETSDRLSETELNSYLESDTNYQGFQNTLRMYEETIRNAEMEGGFKHVPFGNASADIDDKFKEEKYAATHPEYNNILMPYDILVKDLPKYREIMATWQDGKMSDILNINSTTYTNVFKITLSNGQRAYKCDQGVFYPRPNGSPGLVKVPEELIPKDQ